MVIREAATENDISVTVGILLESDLRKLTRKR